jgi:peptide/nickel transport system substrate-binding protein
MIEGARVPASFDLMIFANSPSFRAIAEIIQEEFRKIGVRVQITPAEWALFLEKLNSKEFDAAMLGWATGWTKTDPYQLWHSSLADVPASSNHVGYRNPEVDKLIEQLRVTMDDGEQEKLYHQIHRLIFEDQPYTFLFSEKATAGHDARIENIEFYRIRPCIDTREWHTTRPR